MKKDWWKLVITLLGVIIAGTIGSLFTFQAIPTWYASLEKTVLTPPNWVFSPVWTTLYLLMAIAAYLVWRQSKEKVVARQALTFWWAQLVLNSYWSIVFFGQQNLFGAFIVLIALWLLIFGNIIWFFRLSKVAGWLMIPYILWVSFAGALNYLTWVVNR